MHRPRSNDIAALVKPDRVNQRVYTDPEIFALEMERIFETVRRQNEWDSRGVFLTEALAHRD